MFRDLWPWLNHTAAAVSLDAAGLVALADLSTVAQRTALTGTSTFLDVLVLCPGIHRQQEAARLNGGEYPPMAAMNTGYACRVENPATISYLQKVGRTGHLTTLTVRGDRRYSRSRCNAWYRMLSTCVSNTSIPATIAYLSIIMLTAIVLILLVLAGNWWGVGILGVLSLSRFFNVVVVRRRNHSEWRGAEEPGVEGDMIIFLNQDRWVRLRGQINDVKAVTSGQWLREASFIESAMTAIATVLVYMAAALASNVDQAGKVALLTLLLSSAGLLAVANEATDMLCMHGRLVSMQQPRQQFARRLAMVNLLVGETGRDDWARRMGLIVEDGEPRVKSHVMCTTQACSV